jgi:tetrahydromethanopterin S-methyltransferase subunit G
MEIRKRALGIAIGLVLGLAMLLGTWYQLLLGSPGEIMSKFSNFYIGYTYSWGGAVIGLIWGFVYGFVAGFIIAWVYNFVNKFISKPKTT